MISCPTNIRRSCCQADSFLLIVVVYPSSPIRLESRIDRTCDKMRLLKVAMCNLNQWPMEFNCNLKNVKDSIIRAKEVGDVIRLGLELEITGYCCEDHFLELDIVSHAWECLKDLLLGDWTDDILCSFGMPVIKGSERSNCQVLCMNRKIIMIRAKMWLANDGNYRELRWFTAWKQKDKLEEFQLPTDISEALSQRTTPFGYGFMHFLDT